MLTLLRISRLVILLAWTVLLAPFQLAAVALRSPLQGVIPVLFHRGAARVMRIAIDVRGTPSTERPVLFVANHSSWLDIVVLSAIVPTSFVAKSEIAGWAGFNILAKLQRSVFVERKRRKAKEGVTGIRARLAASDNLVLFGEGTSGDGNHILPFKSAMFSAAEIDLGGGRVPWVQPVSIAYTRLDGYPLGRRLRHHLTWYGTMSLRAHLWGVLGQGHARVVVEFHPAVRASDFPSRKELALHCQQAVTSSYNRAITGCLGAPPPRLAVPPT